MSNNALTLVDFCEFLKEAPKLRSNTVLEYRAQDNAPIYYGFETKKFDPENDTTENWVDFLNLDTEKQISMWYIYNKSAKFIEDFILDKGFSIEGLNLLSKSEFIDDYSRIFQKKTERLQNKIKREIGEDIPSIGEPGLPPYPRKITAVGDGSGKYKLEIPEAQNPFFWLSIIGEGLILHRIKYDEIKIRKCEAPDCRKYFLPDPRGHGQKYHDVSCQNRHYMQKRRKK